MKHELRVSGIVEDSIVDGPGLRLVVFTQGCPHRCGGCHNPHTHDPSAGNLVGIDEIIDRFDQNPLLAGITFSGGEPVLQAEPLVPIAGHVKGRGKSVLIFTGYLFEQLLDMAGDRRAVLELLQLADTIIDGPYIKELRDLTLQFRGSSNQRVLEKPAMLRLAETWRKGDQTREKSCRQT